MELRKEISQQEKKICAKVLRQKDRCAQCLVNQQENGVRAEVRVRISAAEAFERLKWGSTLIRFVFKRLCCLPCGE